MFRPVSNFGKSSQTWDSLRPQCKDCLKELNKQNKEQRTEYNKKYWQETKEEQTEKNRQWRENNKDRQKENMKKWLEANVERKKEMDKKYRKEHYEEHREYMKKWKRENYNKMKEDPDQQKFTEYRIKTNIGRRIREMLGQTKNGNTTVSYCGCSLEKLRIHLETQWSDGMSWSNYGVGSNEHPAWHIDHRIPISSFDMGNPVHVLACFHYKNLQPLWWDENIRKSGKCRRPVFNLYMKKFIETLT
jgi:hypothetical protein